MVLVFGVLLYVLQHRRLRGFFAYLGLTRAPWSSIRLAAVWGLVSVPIGIALSEGLLPLVLGDASAAWRESPNTTGNQLIATGAKGATLMIAALLKGGVQTALVEELLFRGIVAKRLIGRLGFRTGNVLQAFIFLSIHVMLFVAFAREHWISLTLILGPFPFVLGLLAGWLNHQARGSILPGWVLHGLANALTYLWAVSVR